MLVVSQWLWRICCRVASWCWRRRSSESDQPEPATPQHPLTHLFVGDDQSCLLDLSTILQLRATARCFSEALSSAQLRSRLHTSIARSGIDTQLVQFDESLCGGTVLAALWIAEEGGRWDDGTADVLRLADHCGACTLPVVLTAEDINTHANKTAYVSVPRVIAKLKMVGRHINLGDGVTFQLFQHGDRLRAIKDEPGFELTLDPPGLPAGHLYQRHRQDHDPPASSRIRYCEEWEAEDDDSEVTYASVSHFAKGKILNYFNVSRSDEEREIGNDLLNSEDVDRAMSDADRRGEGGGRLTALMTGSPHTPAIGCSTTICSDGMPGHPLGPGMLVQLVLTDSSHPFVAEIMLCNCVNGSRDEQMFGIDISTTEPRVDVSGRPFPCTSQQHCVCPWGPRCVFKYESPATAALAREALGDAVAPIVFDWIDDSDDDTDDDSDDDDGDDGDDDGSSDNGDGDIDDGSQGGSEGDDAAADDSPTDAT